MDIMQPALEEPRPWADDERLQDPFQLGVMNLVIKLVQEFATLAEKLSEGRMTKTQSIPPTWETVKDLKQTVRLQAPRQARKKTSLKKATSRKARKKAKLTRSTPQSLRHERRVRSSITSRAAKSSMKKVHVSFHFQRTACTD